jgi:cytosine/adenosine deaminase-related metal-dependent hydrolase
VIVGPGTIVTGGEEPRVITGAAVRVVGAHIAQVGPAGTLAAAYPDETLWPARGRVLVPGLVNTHAHLGRHLARGLVLSDAAAWERYDGALSPDDVYWSAMAALAEGVRHGVTTVCDFHRSGGCLERSLPEVVVAADKLGVRVATCYGADQRDSPADRRAALEESVGFASELARKRSGRLRGIVGVRATTLAGLEALVHESFEHAGTEIPVHVDLALDTTPAERWHSRAPWRDGTPAALWAHIERAPRGLVAALTERGDALTATGTGSTAALSREAELGWGSDAGVNAPPLPDIANPWASERTQALAHYRRVFVTGATWAGEHFGIGLGTIVAGAPADLALVDYRPATEFSSETVLGHLWAGLMRAPVVGVMVAGEVVMDNGTLASVDEQEIANRARECAARVWGRLG